MRRIVSLVLLIILGMGINCSVNAGAMEESDVCPSDPGRSCNDVSFKPGSEPDGFGGLKWGARLEAFPEMKYERRSEIGGSLPDDLWDFDRGRVKGEATLEIYVRQGEDLKVWKTDVARIEYGFWKGKLCEVTITAKGSDTWSSFRNEVIGRCGQVRRNIFPAVSPSGVNDGHVWYRWAGKVSEMELDYGSVDQIARLWIGSTILRDQIFESMRK